MTMRLWRQRTSESSPTDRDEVDENPNRQSPEVVQLRVDIPPQYAEEFIDRWIQYEQAVTEGDKEKAGRYRFRFWRWVKLIVPGPKGQTVYLDTSDKLARPGVIVTLKEGDYVDEQGNLV
ncbi:MAG: hypothetical protein AAF989_08050, partial [Planctomycetota bacterium]